MCERGLRRSDESGQPDALAARLTLADLAQGSSATPPAAFQRRGTATRLSFVSPSAISSSSASSPSLCSASRPPETAGTGESHAPSPAKARLALFPGCRKTSSTHIYRATSFSPLTSVSPRLRLIQHGAWGVKVLAWLLLNAIPFFLPMGAIAGFGASASSAAPPLNPRPYPSPPTTTHIYSPLPDPYPAWVARVLSGVFLVIQMLLILDFAYAWSDSWVNKEDSRWLAALLASSAACFVGGVTIVGLSYKWRALGGCFAR